MPVRRNAHHAQFPATPFLRTISVTRLGVSAENVVATIDTPSNHHGMFLPERKNSCALDPDRLHQEAVIAAQRSDIQEEIDRLISHVEAGRDLLAAPEPVGRKFDFLAQEFNREANTLCSKAHGRELTRIGLELKSVIDQLREQVQNLE